MGLDIGWTDEDIEALRPFRTQEGLVFRIQDQVVDAVVSRNLNEHPIHMSLLAHQGSRKLFGRNVDSLMEVTGLVFTLSDSVEPSGLRIDIEKNKTLLIDSGLMQYRGWTDPAVHQSETSVRSLRGVADKFLGLADAMSQAGANEDAIEVLEFLVDSIVDSPETIYTLADAYADLGDAERLVALGQNHPTVSPEVFVSLLGRAAYRAGDTAEAAALLRNAIAARPDNRDALNELMRIYIAQRDIEAMVSTLQVWLQNNPNDSEIRTALGELERQLQEAGVDDGDSL
jgi:Flp pilus assembly protein TadD